LFFSTIFLISRIKYSNRVDESIIVDGIERTYHLYIPSTYNGKKSVPLLIVLHGGGGTGKDMEEKTTLRGFDKLAEENFIVVYPDAVENHWNDGRNDPYAYSQQHNINDAGFISALIDHLKEEYNIDDTRIYVTGMSNGGMMTFRLGCELSDKITAIATVAASMPMNLYNSCTPSNKIPVLMIHGTDDPIIPWNGGYVHIFGKNRGRVISILQTVNFWVEHNNCTLQSNKTYLLDVDPNDGTHVWKEEYVNEIDCVKVVLYGIEGGGHTWPGGLRRWPEQLVGKMSNDVNVCEVIWDFLKEFKKDQLKFSQKMSNYFLPPLRNGIIEIISPFFTTFLGSDTVFPFSNIIIFSLKLNLLKSLKILFKISSPNSLFIT